MDGIGQKPPNFSRISVNCEENGCKELDRMQEIGRMWKDAKCDLGEGGQLERCERVCKIDSMQSDLAVRRQVN